MKKFFITFLIMSCFLVSKAQESNKFKIGFHGGITTGEIKKSADTNLGLDFIYMIGITKKLSLGGLMSLTNYSGQTSYTYSPLAATAQYSLTNKYFLGADLGYALLTRSSNTDGGGIYYQPKFGYQAEIFELYLGFKGISSKGETISSINLGLNYKF